MKGRKPKENAERRITKTASGAPMVLPPDGSTEPAKMPEWMRDTDLERKWDEVIGRGAAFRAEDSALLGQFVTSLQVSEECAKGMIDDIGSLAVGASIDDEDGAFAAKNAKDKFALFKQASELSLKLADTLGCSPLARTRIGAAQAQTANATVDIVRKVQSIIEADKKKSKKAR